MINNNNIQTLNKQTNFLAAAQKPKVETKPEEIEIVSRVKAKPQFDINGELTNRTFIKPLPPKGHIVDGGILSMPLDFVKGLKYDAKALHDAWRGRANDHQLGKLNDAGMTLGGLAIASYLFTIKKTPITKTMEFVGFCSFFASMALWPKIALDIPARLIHGFSPFMKYVDSEDRVKEFFGDNQYIPFDMISDKVIERVGKRQRIPKDIPDSRDAVQEKMRQIALQNRTLWMWTAGFGVPVMSSLICNKLEPVVENIQNYFMNKNLNKTLIDFSYVSKKLKDDTMQKNLEAFLELNKNKSVNEALINDLTSILTLELDPNVGIGIKKDLIELLDTGMFSVNESQVKTIADITEKTLKKTANGKISPEHLSAIIPSETQIRDLFTSKNYFKGEYDVVEITKIGGEVSRLINSNVAELEKTGVSIPMNLKHRLGSVLKDVNKNVTSIYDVLKTSPVSTLNDSAQVKLRDFAKSVTSFAAENKAIKIYLYNKLAQAPNTAKAKYWNDVNRALVKALNISQEEIAKTRFDRKFVGELFNRKVWEIATGSREKYQKFIKTISSEIAQIEQQIKPEEMTVQFFKQVEISFNAAADKFRQLGFNNTADKLVGKNGSEVGTLIGVTKSFGNYNLLNLKSTFSAVLNKANVFRTLYQNPEMTFINGNSIPKEVKEELVAFIEYLTTEGRISDYSVKFEFLRNLNPDKTDYSALNFTDNGKINYSFYNAKKLQKTGVFIPSDISFFKRIMYTMFGMELNKETGSALKGSAVVAKMLEDYRATMYNVVGNIFDFKNPNHVTTETRGWQGEILYSKETPKFHSNAVGAPLDEMLYNTCRQIYNSNKWYKMFRNFGAGLLGFTVLSQFLFGRSYKSKVNKGRG